MKCPFCKTNVIVDQAASDMRYVCGWAKCVSHELGAFWDENLSFSCDDELTFDRMKIVERAMSNGGGTLNIRREDDGV